MIGMLGNWRLMSSLGLAALCALAAGWALTERLQRKALSAQLETQTEQLDKAVAVNAGLVNALAALRAEHERQIAALAVQQKSAERRVQRAQEIREGIRHAPAQDDASVAPVLRAAVDRLRRSSPIAGNGEAGQAQPAPGPADLPGKP